MSTPSRMTLDPNRVTTANRRRLHLREIVDAGPEEAQTIGTELRAARARAGLDLREIGDALRIRYRHLEALECGYHSELPGMTYAVGFVRAYAEYLGLNPDDLVRRFKAEAGGVTMSATATAPSVPDLSFSDTGDRFKLPTGISMIAVLAVVLGAGATWYLSRTQDETLASNVPPAPQYVEQETDSRLLRPHPSVPSARATGPEPLAVELTATRAITRPEDPVVTADAEPSDETPVFLTPDRVASAEDVSAAASDAATSDDVAEGVSPPADEPAVAAAVPVQDNPDAQMFTRLAEAPAQNELRLQSAGETALLDEIGPPAPAGPQDEFDGEIELSDARAEPLLPPIPASRPVVLASAVQLSDALETSAPRFQEPAMGTPAPLPAAAAPTAASADIQILALSSSWLRIDDGEGRVLIQRRLREGEVFAVPPRPGLIMAARNAGAFQILVDGRSVGRAGADGEVLSGLPLNPRVLATR